MNDWKLILKVIMGSVFFVGVLIFGLTRMATDQTGLKVDLPTLLEGARIIKENGETKVTIVVFSDMECPACERVHKQFAEIGNRQGVKMVFRHFPLQIHKNSLNGAKSVEAAREMGKGWEMIDLLFLKQEEWSGSANVIEKMIDYAKSLGLSDMEFSERFNSKEVEVAVATDQSLADRLRLNGTPTVFVNGEQIGADFVVDKVTELLKEN